MNLFSKLKLSKDKDDVSQESAASFLDGGRRKGENENPFLSARRTWNDHVGAVIASRRNWQLLAVLSLLIALASVGGVVHIGSQSKFVPYVVEVDKLGQPAAVAPAQQAPALNERVVHAAVASFISDMRLVTPDISLQRKAVFRIYSMLSAKDPATAKTNEWLNGTEDSSPFKRAANETVNTEIASVIPQTADTWQVDWIETVRDRQGALKGKPFRMRALLTVYTVPTTPQTTEEQLRNNPLSIYVRDYSWAKQL
ncbi:VirB8/TrbF family protein [Pseudoduganella aquatica]|uniref:Conjugal transfer protein TrbF n=1 Tax=Pseudoduganella aquatica TaxID=2660641 RepID=A0A7X4KP84_9BURK|nr:VirB8/TrbF family protein [Pseudoduganella aquatica]MYN08906.1 conjugal transfer protein TrbF [Pseudoduganella aquatica]